jgi:ribose 5-phosphate isomerase B
MPGIPSELLSCNASNTYRLERDASANDGFPIIAGAFMKISISTDTMLGIASSIAPWVRALGHEVILRGALDPQGNPEWAWASALAALDVAEGRADQAIVCCTTGTGATIAANKITGVRAALCNDAFSAAGARKWNDANVLGISLRQTSEAEMQEILEAWFGAVGDPAQAHNIAHVNRLDAAASVSD